MNELKFRVWNKKLKAFSYWGFNTIDELPGFASPATGSGVSISDCESLSEQCSGLKDKNGNCGYVNDLCLFHDGKIRTLTSGDGCYGFIGALGNIVHCDQFLFGKLVIVGNIHQK